MGAATKPRLQQAAVVLLLAVLLAALPSFHGQEVPATSSSACGPDISFFPTNREEFNVPKAWGRAAQRQAGNTRDDRLLNVVLLSSGNLPGTLAEGVPSLQVVPSHPLLTLGASGIADECLGEGPGAAVPGTSSSTSATASTGAAGASTAAQRRLLAASGPVTMQASFRLSYSLNGSAPVVVGTYKNVSATAPPTIQLTELATMPDGFYCMVVTVELVPLSGVVGGADAVPLTALRTQRAVCFQKLDEGGKANVTFNTCSQAFNVSISDVSPAPVTVGPASTELLFKTVVHLWANMNRTYNNEWPSDSPEPMFFEHWIVVDDPANTSFLWVPETTFYQGWYNLNVEVSLVTDVPSLLLSGLTLLQEAFSEPTAPEAIRDAAKYVGSMPYNGTATESRAGVQYATARFMWLEGPQYPIVGTIVDFTWLWEGFGRQYCYIDGKRFQNDDQFQCRSPIAPYLDANDHTLVIFLQDVCNNTLNVTTTYGVWGYKTDTPPATPQGMSDDTCYAGEQCAADAALLSGKTTSKFAVGGISGMRTSVGSSAWRAAPSAGMAVAPLLLALALLLLPLR